MSKRVVYMRPPTGAKVQGIFNSTMAFVVEGASCNPNEGGGFVGKMELDGGLLFIRKVDENGKPWRSYGKVSVRNKGLDTVANIEADGVCVSAEGYTLLFNEEVVAANVMPACSACGKDSGGKPLCQACYEKAKAAKVK